MSDTSEEPPRGERGVPCTYSSCQHRFPSVKAMQAHKVDDPEHFYCKKCDVDCDDWESLTKHKVDKMAPFVEGRKRVRDEKPIHIVCEFCGESFKSFDGRKLHRARYHPADQDIDCPGCQKKFIRATHMIDHLERGECKNIASWMLYASINHKYIVNQVMEAPDQFQSALTTFQPVSENFDLRQREVTDGEETADQEDGGVTLLDREDGAGMGGYAPIEPTRDLIDLHPQRNISPQESFPTPPTAQKDITDGFKAITLGEASRKGAQTSNAWAKKNASAALFPYAEPTPRAGDWKAIEQDLSTQKSGNLMATHFWNPDDPNYSVDRFFNHVIQAYECPIPVCEQDTTSYKTLEELQQHIRDMHYIRMFRCEVCFKRFNKVAALMSHVEHTMKCRVKESKNFEKFIAQVTGGFLTAESVSQPKVFKFDKSVIKAGENTVGVQKMKYSGALPN
ncbi:Putative Zinc finger C2H2-type [Septoria linicola]|uniref:Zinc finger C2H2-type n=1 Tax=Septoria linicola TaxID=215465 RepID=A0A9Q9EHX0_9PEZI|nr:putative Zinc finger C2H2-type [Septoria linicola]USW49728.1 Putative Zinc finger C2H2-type [Septoria linicola]